MGGYDRKKFITTTFPRDLMKDVDKLKIGKEARPDVIRRLIIEHNHHASSTPTVRLPGASTLQPPIDFIKAYRIWKSSGQPEPLFYQQCESMGYSVEQIKSWMETIG